MSEELSYRRQVSKQHLEVLAQYMERYPPLALASARSRESHCQSKRMWEKIARTLNRIDENVSKSGKSWARYWIDLKFKIRRKYATIQQCQTDGKLCTVQLNPLEERIVKILTDEKGNLLQTASVYHFPYKKSNSKQVKSNDSQLDDPGGSNSDLDIHDTDRQPTELITVPNTVIKHNIDYDKKTDIDPIQISAEEKKSAEDLRRELLEFELKKQKELFEMDKQFKREKHELEMSILRIRRQVLMKELKKL